MIAATSFCQTSTVSQESLPDPAMVGYVDVLVELGFGCGPGYDGGWLDDVQWYVWAGGSFRECR